MFYKLFIIVLLSITSTRCVEISQTKISTTRNQLRTSLCNFYNGNFTDTDRENAKKLISTYNYLSDQNIQAMLFSQNFSSPAIQSFLIVAPHAVCLVILLFMIPGLACCCARPQKYPVCKKFRKPQNQMYTKVQLKWPSFLTIFCYLSIAVGAGMALAGGPDITNYVNNIGCRLSAVIDDTQYGRISPDNNSVFFVGLTPLKSQLTDFISKYNTFFSQSNSSFNSSHSVRSQQVAIQNQISSTYTAYTDISYTNAFRLSDGLTYTTIASRFKTMYYGPVSDRSKILGNIYSQLQSLFSQINLALDPLIAAWDYLQGQGQPAVSSYITNTVNQIQNHQTSFAAILKNYEYFDNQAYYNWINLSIKVVYGIVLAMGLLGLISAVVLTCFTVVRVRMVIYFTCSFLIFMAIITFCMLIVFAIFLPNVSQACAYIDRKMETPAGIVSLMNNLQFNSSSILYTNCLKSTGTGDMVGSVNSLFLPSFQAIVKISYNTLSFNDLIPNFSDTNFQKPFIQSTTLINSIKTLTLLQVQDSNALNFLKGLANKYYAINSSICSNTANINGDSWVPSRSVISCQGGTFAQPLCTDLSNTVTCPQGCYQLYQQINIPGGDQMSYQSHIQSRYGASCNYAEYVIDLQQRWVTPMGSNLGTVQTDLNTIQTNVNNYKSTVSVIQGNLNGFQSNLVQNFNSQTNQASGSFNGVDCRVIGQSLNQLRDAVCVGLLKSIEYNTIMLCLISYGILLLSCFSVCAGVRHYQHLQKMQVKVGYKGVPVSISSNRIVDKFDS